MQDKYIIINKKNLKEKIEALRKDVLQSEAQGDTIRAAIEQHEMQALIDILYSSIPLKEELEKAFNAANERNHNDERVYICLDEYIPNLKLDI